MTVSVVTLSFDLVYDFLEDFEIIILEYWPGRFLSTGPRGS
jgi:hypothetical protein